ncbi:hypothetical protein [Streptomyces albidoflavus]|nr:MULTISPECIES: hypothetical protein [Streptomyces]
MDAEDAVEHVVGARPAKQVLHGTRVHGTQPGREMSVQADCQGVLGR